MFAFNKARQTAASKVSVQSGLAFGVVDEKAVVEISNIVKLATQAMDGDALSDSEIDNLCDAALSEPATHNWRGAEPIGGKR